MNKKMLLILTGVIMACILQISAFSEEPPGVSIPHLLRFQANIQDSSGMALDGAYNISFKIYDVRTQGAPLWQETHTNVQVQQGLLDLELGSITALELAFDRQYWLGVEVENDGEMSPRFRLTSAPYAFSSEK